MSTYLDYYNDTIAPKLEAIDLFIKIDSENSMTTQQIAKLLDIPHNEVNFLIDVLGIEKLDKVSFFTIMQYGSSEICKLFSREIERKLPKVYGLQDISYIYQIPYEIVTNAANKADLMYITNENIQTLFSNIIMST